MSNNKHSPPYLGRKLLDGTIDIWGGLSNSARNSLKVSLLSLHATGGSIDKGLDGFINSPMSFRVDVINLPINAIGDLAIVVRCFFNNIDDSVVQRAWSM